MHVFNPTTSMQVQYGKTHVEDNVLTQFNDHSLWQKYGCSADMCNSFVGGAAVLFAQTVTGGFSGGEVNSPTSNLSSIHEWSDSVMKTLGNHQLQAGGGWDELNYTAELRQGSVTFSGASTANFNYNTQSPKTYFRVPWLPGWRAVLNSSFRWKQFHGYVAAGLHALRRPAQRELSKSGAILAPLQLRKTARWGTHHATSSRQCPTVVWTRPSTGSSRSKKAVR
jgi:hypothetical protein